MSGIPSSLLDEMLILQAQNGRLEAWEELIRRWQPRLMGTAIRQLGHVEGATDIVQETWISVTRNLQHLDDASVFPAWVHQILSNKIIDWIRQKKRRGRRTGNLDSQEIAEKVPVSREPQELIREGLRKMTLDQRRLLTHFYLEDQSIKQIAESLAIPEGTVKSRLHAAREALRHILEREHHDIS